jgi:hypothetical protein
MGPRSLVVQVTFFLLEIYLILMFSSNVFSMRLKRMRKMGSYLTKDQPSCGHYKESMGIVCNTVRVFLPLFPLGIHV